MGRSKGDIKRMKQIAFTVPGEPKGKGRPRFTKNGHTYTPKDTAEYENLVRLEFRRQCGNVHFDKGAELSMNVIACYGVPNGASRVKRKQMLSGGVHPTKKPDLDNIIKVIADSLNKVAYNDDAQITDVRAQKYYSETPCVMVQITEV